MESETFTNQMFSVKKHEDFMIFSQLNMQMKTILRFTSLIGNNCVADDYVNIMCLHFTHVMCDINIMGKSR